MSKHIAASDLFRGIQRYTVVVKFIKVEASEQKSSLDDTVCHFFNLIMIRQINMSYEIC